MKLPIIPIGFAGLIVSAGIVSAMPALEGTVKDANGRGLGGAEIRIAMPENGSVLKVARTDSSGRYRASDIRADVYQVSLVMNDQVKASIKNVKVDPTDPTHLNFDLKGGKVTPQAQGKHFVWKPSATGTNLSGRWVEVDARGTASFAENERITRGNGGAILKRIQENSGAVRNQ